MNTVGIVLLVVIVAIFVCLHFYVTSDSDARESSRPQHRKMDSEIDDLFSSYTSLNNDALDAYKALIDASFEASMMEQQRKKIEKKDPFFDFNFNPRR